MSTKSAAQAYQDNAARIAATIAKLQKALDADKKAQAKDPKNYGYAGTLAEVAGRLDEIVSFMGVQS